MTRSVWFKAVAVLAAVWLAIGGIVWWARSAKATPESIARYIAEHSVAGKAPAEREKIVRKVAAELNELEYEQRREMRMGKRLDGFYRSLNQGEQGLFLDATLPAGFRQMMEAFNKMAPEERKKIVDKALRDMQSHEGEKPPENDDPNVQKIVQQGLRSFYSDASADVKLDLAPLVEQMQKNVQGLR